MNLTYFGHSCFKVETKLRNGDPEQKKLTVIFDPLDPSIGLKCPSGKVDLILSSHDHYDHNYVKPFQKSDYFLINNPGEYTYRGLNIKGIKTYHDSKEGAERGLNTVFVLENEDIRICHLGDLGHLLDKSQIDQIGEVNVLLIPVGGTYTIGPKEAVEVTKQLEPSFIIPMHYKMPGSNVEKLETPQAFYKELGLAPQEKITKLKLKPSLFKEGETSVFEFSV